MITGILELLFSMTLFITGGNLIDTKFGLHKYSEQDYKDIFYLKNNKSTSKECIRHSKVETLKKVRRSREGGSQTDFQIHNPSATLEKLKSNPGMEIPIASLKHLNLKIGVDVMISSDVPPGSGLGGSSSLTVNFVKILSILNKLKWKNEKVAETSFHIERNVLQHPIGKQDDYIASFGGFNFIRFTKEQIYVEPIQINKSTFDELQENLVLFFVGNTRKNTIVLSNQLENIKKKRNETIEALHYVKGLSEEMNSALKQSDITHFGELLHKGWIAKKKFAKGVSNENINKIYDAALENGASGGKLTGAGGGGHMLFYCEKSKHDGFIQKMEYIGLKHIRFKFNDDGPKVLNLYDYSGK